MTIPPLDLGRTRARIARVLDERWHRVLASSAFILGPEVGELEESFAAFLGAPGCVGVARGWHTERCPRPSGPAEHGGGIDAQLGLHLQGQREIPQQGRGRGRDGRARGAHTWDERKVEHQVEDEGQTG